MQQWLDPWLGTLYKNDAVFEIRSINDKTVKETFKWESPYCMGVGRVFTEHKAKAPKEKSVRLKQLNDAHCSRFFIKK